MSALELLASPKAVEDLGDIWEWIANDNPGAADCTLVELHRTFRLLAETPEMGRVRDEVIPGIRSFPKGRHVIFYRVRGETLEIVRVLHGSRDYTALF